ncbi:class II D-tagatose-bisphosphate aldolase, non-catalytic subunit [Candidatus Pacearchaeota archaeon]|nr:class II D-tagatose-bisphosphate aldolase, non-catalytic subunit [Candidatus Pacearchaeota archaeon]
MADIQLAIGPMSSETIEAVFRHSHYRRRPLLLIASKNQIDHAGGYVNNWTTHQYMEYIREMRSRYPYSQVLICRDHCGPGFNGIHDLDDIYKTISTDIKEGFDLIHIDFCHYKGSVEEQQQAARKAIEYSLQLNPHIMLEVGTDENVGSNYSMISLDALEREVDFFKSFCNPTFYVVQTGSLVKEMQQVGNFNTDFVKRIHHLLNEKGLKLKEHNADYLSSGQLALRKGNVDAVNIAPQLGVVQSTLVLTKSLVYGIDIQPFLELVHAKGKWGKWLHTNTADNKMLCALTAGHYHFASDEYKKIIEQLNQREDVHESIINTLMEVVNHYDSSIIT